ncbi:MAG TPA: ABC transporter substrate-binding protein [Candidatus Babeliales bacterium]|nr:ABC transporter substrate-binding protein [Candidatus Babeliales bacterium]
MKKQIYAVIVSCIVVMVVAVYFGIFKKADTVADYRIALFVPAEHPAMTEILDGFQDTIHSLSNKKYVFDEYNANGNATLLRAQADEIIQNKYDLVFTIGTQCTQSIFEISKKRQSPMPQVFTAVDDPVSMGIVVSFDQPGGRVTGITDNSVYDEQIDALLRVKPNVKTILLVYNPSQGRGLEKNKEELEAALRKKNIALRTVAVGHQNEIMQKVANFLTDVDVLMILTDHTTVAGIDSLITLCGRYGVTLFASDLNSADKGAALAFGVLQRDYGVLGARLAHQILEDKQAPSSIAVRPLEQLYLKINTKTMEQQALPLTQEQLVQLKKEGVIVV